MHTRKFSLAASMACAALAAGLAFAPGSFGEESNPVQHEPPAAAAEATFGVIIKLRKDAAGAAIAKLATAADRNVALAKRTNLPMTLKREISGSMLAHTVELKDLSADQVLERLRADPAVEFAVPDRRRYAQALPNDPLFAGQWYLKNAEVSAVNATAAWDLEQGSRGIVVAVIDTGVLYDHPDLGRGDFAGRLLPGYDFVAAPHMVNDGDSRDADPSDPGDWVSSTDQMNAALANCALSDSSWHGTRVAGMIGALTNNGIGIAGLNWNSYILPVRVLGKCGGIDSDILAGMRWAAGLPTPGVATNPTPARVLNMSLGASGACDASYMDVIDELTANKVLVVISAGNDGSVVSSPANCPGVAAIAAIRHAGSKVGFSNLGPEVTLAAPGGNCVNVNGGPCLFSLDTTSNDGATVPSTHSYTDQINFNLGTSFSAPIVSGIASLMLSRNANLSTAQLLARLREGATPFPTTIADAPTIQACHIPVDNNDFQSEQCLCTATTCGAGMANALNSVLAADRPIAAIAVPANVSAGQNVTLNAAGSTAACGRTVAGFSWTVVAPAVNPPAIVGANTSSATVVAPVTGAVTLRVTVTDSLNHVDTADVIVGPTSASTTAPASAGTTACAAAVTSGPTPVPPAPTPNPPPIPSTGHGGGGGGGGSLGLVTLALLGGLALARSRHRRRPHFSRCI